MDFLKVTVIVLFVLLTIITVHIHPDMHQPMILEDANFKVTRISDNLTAKNIPVTKKEVADTNKTITSTPQKEIKLQDTSPAQNKTKYVQQEEQKPIRKTKRFTQEEKDTASQLELLQRIINQAEQQTAPSQDVPYTPPKQQQPKQDSQPVQKQEVRKNSGNPKNPYMTEQEEIIAWNKWRSAVQNRIMDDSKIDYAPLGTVFMFSFVADKFGNVSNIKVVCSNPAFMDVARNNVKPAIANLQKQPILRFPRGTQRTSTVVTGLFIIGTEERYSTPNDFSDFERVKY